MSTYHLNTHCACLEAQEDIGIGLKLQAYLDLSASSLVKSSVLRVDEGHPLFSRELLETW